MRSLIRQVRCFLPLIAGLFTANCKNKMQDKVEFLEDRKKSLDEFIGYIQYQYRIPGIAYAVVQGDSVYCNAFGIKDELGEPMTVSTPILAGNLSEPMLAYAALQLQRSGRINLEDKVVKHLPYFKMGGTAYDQIRVKNLLTHTSGIDDYTVFYDRPVFGLDALEITTRSIATQQPKWDVPEIQILRSPYNYDILADLLQKVSGEPFEEYVKRSVFDPHQMESAAFCKIEGAAQPFVTKDFLDYSFQQSKVYPYTRANGGSRGLHASVQDFAKWMFDLFQDKDFAGKFLQISYKSSETSGIGLGWDIFMDEDGTEFYTKTSEFGGFGNQIVLLPSRKIAVLIMTNISSDFNPSKVAGMIASWLDNKADLTLKIPVHLKMGVKLKETGRVADALQEYRFLKREHADMFDFSEKSLLLFGANVLKRENRIAQAIEIFKFCKEEFPNSAEVYLNLAEAYLDNGDLEACRLQIEKAMEISHQYDGRDHFVRYLQERMEILTEKKELDL